MAIDVGVKGALITGGLGRPACSGLITAFPFQLLCIKLPPEPIPPARGTGGSIPLAPGEIHGFYKPVDPKIYVPDTKTTPTQQDGEFVDPKVFGKRHVVIKVTSRFFKGEKEFIIPEKRYNTVFKVMNIVNRTMERMTMVATSIRNVATRAKVYIKNLRRHK